KPLVTRAGSRADSSTILGVRSAARHGPHLDRCDLAVVEDVLAPATLAFTDRPVVSDQLDRTDPFDHLVAELALEPKAEGRAEGDRQWLAIHLVREDGLGVPGDAEVDDSVEVAVFASVLPFVVERSEQQVPGFRQPACSFEQ